VFVDIDTIGPGEDFAEAIDKSLSSCTVLVALIGRGWLSAVDAAGGRRVDRTDDFVRLEIAKALERHVRVVPALVGDAVMPEANELPQDLRALARRQAIEISDSRFHQDVDRLIESLSDTPLVRTRQEAPKLAATDATRGMSTPPWAWIFVTAVVVLAMAAGYSRFMARDATSEVTVADPGQRADATVSSSTQSAEARTAAPTSQSDKAASSQEREPNDDILHPNVLTIGATLRAEIQSSTDKDFYRIRTPAGNRTETRVVISKRSGSSRYLEAVVWDGKFNSVTSKDSAGDLYLSFDALPSADYFLEVRLWNPGPQEAAVYDLTFLSALK